MRGQAIPGPGTLRVGRFIGRLGIVSLPAVQAGLELDQRVVRRHVAKLEAAGWLEREPWVWGEGSVVWLTAAGLEAAGLGGVRAVKSPPGPTTIAHGVLVGWSAARVGGPDHLGRFALGLIARDAAEMLGTDQRGRVRICGSETCSARFYDRSRAGQRRWCSMQACGNVAKARRHRARHAH